MTVDRDPKLDSVLTAPPKEAWQVIFEKLWEIFSAPLTPRARRTRNHRAGAKGQRN